MRHQPVRRRQPGDPTADHGDPDVVHRAAGYGPALVDDGSVVASATVVATVREMSVVL